MKKYLLFVGDILALAIVTIIGFTSHGEVNTSFLPRMAAALIPLIISWFAVAPWLGLFDSEITSNPRLLWRPALTMVFAGPLAVLIRGLILNAPVIPIFGVVLSMTSALGMTIWRWVYILISKRIK